MVLFSGDYIVRQTIVIRHNHLILKGGASSEEGTSRLVFTSNNNNNGPGILVEPASGCCGEEDDVQSRKIHAGSANSQVLIVDAHPDFLPNTYAWINVVRPRADSTSAVAGQMVKITSVRNAPDTTSTNRRLLELTIEGRLGIDYGQQQESRIRTRSMIRYTGIQDLTMTTSTAGSDSTNVSPLILLRSAADCWIRNVVSTDASLHHVETRLAYRCEIRDCDFARAHRVGDGGQGYGVNLASQTTATLVTGNSFRQLRHSILLNTGATGNVIRLNHSRNPRHPNFSNGGPADISFHAFSVANLVEQNLVERIEINDAGVAGPFNTIIRNCLSSGPLTLRNGVREAFVGANAMYGSNDLLRQRTMPAIPPPTVPNSPEQPYLRGDVDIFGPDGTLQFPDMGPDNTIVFNWHVIRGIPSPDFDAVPTNLYASSNDQAPILQSRTGDVNVDCDMPALQRLGDLIMDGPSTPTGPTSLAPVGVPFSEEFECTGVRSDGSTTVSWLPDQSPGVTQHVIRRQDPRDSYPLWVVKIENPDQTQYVDTEATELSIHFVDSRDARGNQIQRIRCRKLEFECETAQDSRGIRISWHPDPQTEVVQHVIRRQDPEDTYAKWVVKIDDPRVTTYVDRLASPSSVHFVASRDLRGQEVDRIRCSPCCGQTTTPSQPPSLTAVTVLPAVAPVSAPPSEKFECETVMTNVGAVVSWYPDRTTGVAHHVVRRQNPEDKYPLWIAKIENPNQTVYADADATEVSIHYIDSRDSRGNQVERIRCRKRGSSDPATPVPSPRTPVPVSPAPVVKPASSMFACTTTRSTDSTTVSWSPDRRPEVAQHVIRRQNPEDDFPLWVVKIVDLNQAEYIDADASEQSVHFMDSRDVQGNQIQRIRCFPS